MKFLPIIVSSFLCLGDVPAIASSHAKNLSSKLQSRIEEGRNFNRQQLLANAKPYDEQTKQKLRNNKKQRKLENEDEEEQEDGEANEDGEENQDGEEAEEQAEDWEISSIDSIQFSQCLNLKVEDEDLADEDIASYAQNGMVISTKSYILFQAVDTYGVVEGTFITDVASFVFAFISYLPDQMESYCQGCEENNEYCQGNMQQDDYAYNNGGEDGDNEQGRRRKLADGQVVEYIDCDTCFDMGCIEKEDDYNYNYQGNEQQDAEEEYDIENGLEWIKELTDCQATDVQWNDMDLSSTLVCNSQGTGIEIGLFIDEDCTLFAPGLSYFYYVNDAESLAYYELTQEYVQYMFTNDVSCSNEEITYINEYDEVEEEDNDGEDDGEEDEERGEAAEWCQGLFESETFAPLSLEDCGAEEAEEEDYNYQYQEQGQNGQCEYGDWCSYEVSQEQLEDTAAICTVVQSLEGVYSTYFDEAAGESLYDYDDESSNAKSSNFNISNGGIVGIAIAAAVVLIVLACCINRCCCRRTRGAPLIAENEKGQMS